MTGALERIVDHRTLRAVLGLWGAGVVLSTVQIYLRELARGFSTPWPEVLWANCLAWSPWLAIVPLALWLERRFPLWGDRSRFAHAAVHAVVACVVSATFLAYLALFHWAYLGERAVVGHLAEIRAVYLGMLDRFFLTAALLYGAIVIGGLAGRVVRAHRAARRRDVAGPARVAVPAPALVVRSVGRVERVEPASVDWIEACGNYARLHLGGSSTLIRRTLTSLADELAAARFARIHRSAIVNLDRVVELRRLTHGEAMLVLRDGHELKVSRTFRDALERLTS